MGKPRTITLAHGSGGKATRELIRDVFLAHFQNPWLARLEDQARMEVPALAEPGARLAMTTDGYVVTPLFFPGGDIGSLAVNGTVNDLAVGGARPLYLSASFILEEGLELSVLERVAASMRAAADRAGVAIVTGDTKVVPHGAADQLFISTAGVGVIPPGRELSANTIRPGDRILLNGELGNHGAAILDARGELALENSIPSDCQSLQRLTEAMLRACPGLRCMRDATRGGLATVLNEFATEAGVCMRIQESAIPLREDVRGMCELLGLDPLYLANEGKVVAVCPPDRAEAVLAAMRELPEGRGSAIIGEVVTKPAGMVIMTTSFGGDRVVDVLYDVMLPRIC
jgi:hydrogenase expression/formation protein HypE